MLFRSELLVLAELRGDDSSPRIFVVHALYDLPEGPLIHNLDDFISVPELLANRGQVVPLLISYRVLVLTPDASNGIDSTIYSKLYLLKLSQLITKFIKRFLRTPSIKALLGHKSGTLRA